MLNKWPLEISFEKYMSAFGYDRKVDGARPFHMVSHSYCTNAILLLLLFAISSSSFFFYYYIIDIRKFSTKLIYILYYIEFSTRDNTYRIKILFDPFRSCL